MANALSIGGLPPVVWLGHAAQTTLLVACATITWWGSKRAAPLTRGWQRFWTCEPWLASLACALVVGVGATSILELWAAGLEAGWAPVRFIALGLGQELLTQWTSMTAALGVWCLLVLWPTAFELARPHRLKLVLAVACFWAGLGAASWCCRAFLVLLPETMAPTYLPFEALAPARALLARGVLALAVSLGVGGSLVAWALWHAPARAVTRQHWVGSVAVTALAATALLMLTPVGSRFAWENAHPLEPRFRFSFCTGCEAEVTGLDGSGPHAPVDAPWVVLSPSGFRVDGVPARTHDELQAILKNKRELWRQLNPQQDFPGAVMIDARALPTVGELGAAFRTVLRAGYPNAHLAFSEVLRQTRPILGGVLGQRNSALRVFLAEWRADCPVRNRRVLHLGAASERPLAPWVRELGARAQDELCAVLPKTNCAACRGSQEPSFEVVREWSLGEHVEALELRRGQEEYQVALVGRDSAIEVELMNDPQDPWDGFAALEVRSRKASRRLLWAMNAGMYHPDRSPVGLLVSGSDERAPLNTQRGRGNFFLMPNGVFAVSDSGPGVQTTSAWQNDVFTEPREATQSGPMLVIEGGLHPAFERGSPSRLIRNGIGVAGEIVVMAISTTRVNFHEFATSMRDLGCANALYLDGNVSSVFAPELERRDPGLGLGPVLVVTEPAN